MAAMQILLKGLQTQDMYTHYDPKISITRMLSSPTNEPGELDSVFSEKKSGLENKYSIFSAIFKAIIHLLSNLVHPSNSNKR